MNKKYNYLKSRIADFLKLPVISCILSFEFLIPYRTYTKGMFFYRKIFCFTISKTEWG